MNSKGSAARQKPMGVDQVGAIVVDATSLGQQESAVACVRHRLAQGAMGLVLIVAGATCVAPRVMAVSARDAATTAVVERRLDLDPTINADAIQVRTDDGTVYLTGIVATSQQKRRVEHLARSVRGVRAIVSDVRIVPPADDVTPSPFDEWAQIQAP